MSVVNVCLNIKFFLIPVLMYVLTYQGFGLPTYKFGGGYNSTHNANRPPPQIKTSLTPAIFPSVSHTSPFQFCPYLACVCTLILFFRSDQQQLQLLYSECILSVLSSSSPSMHLHRGFTDLIW